MKIAYVTTYDARDVNAWSGLGHSIWSALEHSGAEIDLVGPLDISCPPQLLARRIRHRYLHKKQYLWERSPRAARGLAAQVQRALKGVGHDFVFAPDTVPVAYLEAAKPVVTWTDATFASMLGFYPGLNRTTVAAQSIDEALQLEATAIARSRLSIYGSDWAARSAIEDFGADRDRVKVVPFGANITGHVSEAEVAAAIRARPPGSCRLVFLGRDWERKGGPQAVAVTEKLNELGVETKLTVMGCEPAIPPSARRFVEVAGFIDKGTGGGSRIGALLSASHFLILPTRAESFGLPLCEANAYGVPCLTTNVGGVPTVVRDGINGKLFGVDDAAGTYAAYVHELLADRANYDELAFSSYREYRTRLSWPVAAGRIIELLETI